MSYNFNIGQDVVALENGKQTTIKEGDTFPLKGIMAGCNHHPILLNVGFSTGGVPTACEVCGLIYCNSSIWWFDSIHFAPLDELTDISELQEVLEQPLFKVQ